MMRATNLFREVLQVALFLPIFVSACNEYDAPDPIFDPNAPLGESPVITAVDPPNVAGGGVNEINLVGNNFSPVPENNLVYINGEQIELKRASEGQLTLYRPAIVGENLDIKVVVTDKVQIARHGPYAITQVLFEHGDFSGSNRIYAIALDNDENLYAMSAARVIWKVTPQGEMSEYATTTFRSIDDMHVGPGGYLYIARGRREFNRVPPGGGSVETFGSIPQNIEYFDFDENGNIFAGGSRGLFIVAPDGTGRDAGRYDRFYRMQSVRVFNGAVYIVAEYRGTEPGIPAWAIWRNEILNPAGDLGENQVAVDWSASEFSDSKMTSLTFASDGTMIVGTDSDAAPVVLVYTDGVLDILYRGILPPAADQLVWGAGASLYLNRGLSASEQRVVRLDMGQPGAPYYGRR